MKIQYSIMSWLSDLAGKAETILNQIDQNAANVLKTDNDQLLEVKISDNERKTDSSAKIRKATTNGAMKLLRTPKQTPSKDLKAQESSNNRIHIESQEKSNVNADGSINIDKNSNDNNNDNNNLNNNNHDNVEQSGASNSSRRSSWSSRTEGVTVIEYPTAAGIQLKPSTAEMSTSMHSNKSNQSVDENRNELAAIKIVVSQLKLERDRLKSDLEQAAIQAANNNADELIANYERCLEELSAEKEQLNERLEQITAANEAHVKSISELETTLAKLHQSETETKEKLKLLQVEREHAMAELQQYRVRAQHTLQQKDRLIAELKNANLAVDQSDGTASPSESPLKSENTEVRLLEAERSQLQIEMQTIRFDLENVQQQNTSLLTRIADSEQRSREREHSLNTAVQQEKILCSQIKDTLQIREKELEAIRSESMRQQTDIQLRLHQR